MGGHNAPTVCPTSTSRPSLRCRSPETQSWTEALDMASVSLQMDPCWSGMSSQVQVYPTIVFLWLIFKLKCEATETGYGQIPSLFKSRKNVREIFQSGAVLKKERSKYLIVDSIRIT